MTFDLKEGDQVVSEDGEALCAGSRWMWVGPLLSRGGLFWPEASGPARLGQLWWLLGERPALPEPQAVPSLSLVSPL